MYWSRRDGSVVPAEVVTVTSTVPAACAGLTAVIVASSTTLKLAADAAPKLTPVTPVLNPVPLIVTDVPPATGPLFGVTPVTATCGRSEAPTLNDQVYDLLLTVSATTYLTPL